MFCVKHTSFFLIVLKNLEISFKQFDLYLKDAWSLTKLMIIKEKSDVSHFYEVVTLIEETCSLRDTAFLFFFYQNCRKQAMSTH